MVLFFFSMQGLADESGQIIATSHDRFPQKIAKEGTPPYFREFQVGENECHSK